MNLGPWNDHDDDDHYQQCDHDRVIRQELLPGSYGKFHIHAFILSGQNAASGRKARPPPLPL